jgi:hypothetical protein
MKIVIFSGEIENLTVCKKSRNLLFKSEEKDILGIGSIAAASIGESLSSTSMINSSVGAEIEMEFFSCTVRGEVIKGSFYKVEFKNGQVIDFVINQWSDKEVLAARDPLRRIIWAQPYCTKGHHAQLKSNIEGSLLISAFAAMALFAADYFSGSSERLSRLESAISQGVVSFILTLIVCFFVCRRIFKDSLNATLIFEVLGFSGAAYVNLPKGNRKAEKNYAAETGDDELEDVPWRFRYDKSAIKLIE